MQNNQPENTMHQFIKSNYDHNMYTNTYKCKHCGMVDTLKYNERSNSLFLHIQQSHRDQMNPNFARPSANQPSFPKIMIERNKNSFKSQYNYYAGEDDRTFAEQNRDDGISDEWLERLAIHGGFNIRQILTSIFTRHRENGNNYSIYLENKALRLKNSIERIKKYINNKIPLLAHPNQVADEIVQKFRISPHGARLVMEDFMLIYRKDYEVTDELRRRGMTIYRYEEERLNTVVYFCDDVMKYNFSVYGDCVFINFRPCTIKRYGQNRKILVGTMTGQNTSYKHVLFGTCLIVGESVKHYRILLKYFMKAMKIQQLPPNFIITDSEILAKAIQTLRYSNIYCRVQKVSSWYHLQEQLKKIMPYIDPEEKEFLIKKYMSVISSLNQEEAQKILEELRDKHSQSFQIFMNFMSDNRNTLMAYTCPGFVGFGIEREHGKIVNHMAFKYFDKLETLGFFYVQSMRMFQQKMDVRMKQIELIKFEQFKTFQIPLSDELRYLSIRLQKPVFVKFLGMYRTAMFETKVITRSTDQLSYEITQKPLTQKTHYTALIYTVHYSLADQCWKCNCNLIHWSGIPCAHLIKIIRLFRGSLTYYINKRWFIRNQRFNPQRIHHPQQAKMQPQYDNDYSLVFAEQCVKVQEEIQPVTYKEDNQFVIIDEEPLEESQSDKFSECNNVSPLETGNKNLEQLNNKVDQKQNIKQVKISGTKGKQSSDIYQNGDINKNKSQEQPICQNMNGEQQQQKAHGKQQYKQ